MRCISIFQCGFMLDTTLGVVANEQLEIATVNFPEKWLYIPCKGTVYAF